MIYYELNKAVADFYHNGVRYWVSNSDANANSWIEAMQRKHGNHKLLQQSERAWREEDGVVKFIKHRGAGIMTPVDMREFFLVKLRARTAQDITQ